MVAREDDGRRPELLGHTLCRAMGQFSLRRRPGGDDDSSGSGTQGVEVELIMRTRDDVLPEQRVVAGAVVLGR